MDDSTLVKHMPTNYVLRSDKGSEEFPLRGEMLVGREVECAIALDSGHISRYHAKIHVTPNGVYLEDLQSTNGTYVNGAKIRGRIPINVGDKIAFDDLVFRLTSPAAGSRNATVLSPKVVPKRDRPPEAQPSVAPLRRSTPKQQDEQAPASQAEPDKHVQPEPSSEPAGAALESTPPKTNDADLVSKSGADEDAYPLPPESESESVKDAHMDAEREEQEQHEDSTEWSEPTDTAEFPAVKPAWAPEQQKMDFPESSPEENAPEFVPEAEDPIAARHDEVPAPEQAPPRRKTLSEYQAEAEAQRQGELSESVFEEEDLFDQTEPQQSAPKAPEQGEQSPTQSEPETGNTVRQFEQAWNDRHRAEQETEEEQESDHTQMMPALKLDQLVERNRFRQLDIDVGSGSRLVIMSAPLRGKVFEFDAALPGTTWQIGRDATSDICLSDKTISVDHARLTKQEDGFILSATHAKNGLLVNGQPHTQTSLKHDDRIQMGGTEMIFKNDYPLNDRTTRGMEHGQRRGMQYLFFGLAVAMLAALATLLVFSSQ